MSPHGLSLLLTLTLLGTCYSQSNCSFNSLVDRLNLPNASVRPVKNWRNITNVIVDMTLYTVIDLDTSLQSLTTLIWFSMEWINEFVSWNPVENCNITNVLMTGNNFWILDLYVYEMTQSADSSIVIPYYTVKPSGNFKVAKPMQIVSSCELDIYRFPFDTQTCSLTFGSYIYTVQEVIMTPKYKSEVVFANSEAVFVNKGDWELKNIDVNVSTLPDAGNDYSKVTYKITLKRVPVVYVITLIIPASFMILLDLISMFIQAESGERLGFKITIVLGFSVLLLILNNILPTSDTSPVLGIFCCICMAVMVISIAGCILVSYMLMLSESQHDVPAWVQTWVMRYLARILCFRESSFRKRGAVIADMTYNNSPVIAANMGTIKKPPQDISDHLEVKLLKKLLKEILKIREELVSSRNQEEVKSEWHAAALVVDRLVLIVYLIIVISLFTAVIIVWSSP